MNFTNLINNYEEAVAMILFGIGFSNLLLQKNLIKKIIGLNIMDTAMYLFLALKGYIAGRNRSWWMVYRAWRRTSTRSRQVLC